MGTMACAWDAEERMLFRAWEPQDSEQIERMHDTLFPVKYTKDFYENAVRGIGLGGKEPLFTNAVVLQRKDQSEEIIGFVCAQFFFTDKNSDVDLFPYDEKPDQIMYILTLGVKEEFRRIGLAARLLQSVIDRAAVNTDCGAVYLHVIDYNNSAMRFYEKNGFQRLRCVKSFYEIQREWYDAFIYIRYTREYKPTAWWRIANMFSSYISDVSAAFEWLSNRVTQWIVTDKAVVSLDASEGEIDVEQAGNGT